MLSNSNNNTDCSNKAKVLQRTKHANALNTTLPMEDLISLFAGEIRDQIEYDSFEFEESKSPTHIFIGIPKLHKCHYKISFGETEFGQISVTRMNPFTDRELSVIEGALAALSIHLTNALSFQAELGDDALNSLQVDRLHRAAS